MPLATLWADIAKFDTACLREEVKNQVAHRCVCVCDHYISSVIGQEYTSVSRFN